jgi:hypothetical protein
VSNGYKDRIMAKVKLARFETHASTSDPDAMLYREGSGILLVHAVPIWRYLVI